MTAYTLASRFLGLKEQPGPGSNPIVLGMLKYAGQWPTSDAVPWCSAFVWSMAYLLDLPRPQTAALAARSWLTVGVPVELADAIQGFDVVVLSRGAGGHVGFYQSHTATMVSILAGNQGDMVSIASFPRVRVLGLRRLA